jgi:hypothetical protein
MTRTAGLGLGGVGGGVKIERISAASASCWSLPGVTPKSRDVNGCSAAWGAPRTLTSAALRPGWASLMASWTPTSPAGDRRGTKPRLEGQAGTGTTPQSSKISDTVGA